jgi:hypothetical protein
MARFTFDLLGFPIDKTIGGLVKGKRYQIPPSIIDMNRRVKDSSKCSPWSGNYPGQTWEYDYSDEDFDYSDEDFDFSDED